MSDTDESRGNTDEQPNEVVVIHYRGRAAIIGSDADEEIHSYRGTDVVFGEGGDDTIYGGTGPDLLFGGSGDDTIEGGAGSDKIFGGSGDDRLTGGADPDVFVFGPGGGNDTITDFNTAEDTINLCMFGSDVDFTDLTITATADGTGTVITLPGDDGGSITLQGVTSTDVTADMFVFAADPTGDDILVGDETGNALAGTGYSDAIIGAGGDDTIRAGGDRDYLFGGEGDDTIYAGGGNDYVFGGAGADTIYAGAGVDIVYGGEGNDTIYTGSGHTNMGGGDGADTFVVQPGAVVTTIRDFTIGEDRIDLSGLGITSFDDLTIVDDIYSGYGAEVHLTDAQGGGIIRVLWVPTANLDADDFTFAEPPAPPIDDGM